jgi:hypothetical protein
MPPVLQSLQTPSVDVPVPVALGVEVAEVGAQELQQECVEGSDSQQSRRFR